ncbi:MAG: GAF domain-containing protein [Candidatus Omnitrophica bacterium]|nr:GAF domain-containing protein [Candidatus Omnitrophota bacterium]MBI2174537.1 GAF domain-containing protein [Candidatus Omnitrophota bacterium]
MGESAGQKAKLALLELIHPPRWQSLQNHLTSVLGVPIRTVSPTRTLLVDPSWPTPSNADRMIELLKIGEELPALLPPQALPTETLSHTTALGVTFAVVPIRVNAQQIIAYFVVGPMVVGPREEELQFRNRISAMELDDKVFWPLLLSLRLYTFVGIRSVLGLIEEVGSIIVQLAYQAKESAAEKPTAQPIDREIFTYHKDRVLRSLLESAALATKAEGGSVMVFDEKSQTLRLKMVHGVGVSAPPDTTLKHGEGLAGLAVLRRQILLLDEQTQDELVRSRMHHPEIVSSLVAPLQPVANSEPMAVLNLHTRDPQRRFTNDHVDLLQRLLSLAEAALGSLPSACL